jgi:hypothetical protein
MLARTLVYHKTSAAHLGNPCKWRFESVERASVRAGGSKKLTHTASVVRDSCSKERALSGDEIQQLPGQPSRDGGSEVMVGGEGESELGERKDLLSHIERGHRLYSRLRTEI